MELRLRSLLGWTALILIAPAWSPASEIGPASVHAVWLAEDSGILKLAADGGEVVLRLPTEEPVRAIEVDLLRLRVWAIAGSTLLGFELDGTLIAQIALDRSTPADVLLEVDAADGSLWIGIERDLRNVSTFGQLLAQVRLDHQLEGLAVDSSQRRVWAATRTRVMALDATSGATIEALDFGSHVVVRDVDLGADGALWVVTGDGLYRVADHTQTLVLSLPDAEQVVGTAEGGAWVAGRKELVRISPGGLFEFQVEPFSGTAALEALVPDPNDSSVWVAKQQSVAGVSIEGEVTLAGTFPRVWDLSLSADIIPPLLSILAPPEGSWVATSRPEIRIAFSDRGEGVDETGVQASRSAVALPIRCTEVAVGEAQCQLEVDLPEGESRVVLAIVDRTGNASEPASITLRVDTIPPAPAEVGRILVESSPGEGIVVRGEPGSVEPLVEVELTRVGSDETVTVAAGADGSFQGLVGAEEGDEIEIVLRDAAGNLSPARLVAVPQENEPPPDPDEVAPALDTTLATDIAASTAFLYSGPVPIQSGVAPGTIEPRRVAVLRGRVLDATGLPLAGVQVSIHSHPEYGQTLSREDGMFDLAVNGGGVLTVSYAKTGLLPVQRKVAPAWRDFTWVDDVAMIPFDGAVTEVAADSPFVQAAAGSLVADRDGQRRAVLIFPAGTGANVVMPDGSTQPLTTLSVRATEYTVGELGPRAMPAELPETTGYTYAVELSIDEAVAVGAEKVEFSQPVFHYVDNFLGFPVGGIVPTGWYDRERGAWIPSDNGRVIRILGVASGLAQVDVDGTGQAASEEQLSALSFTEGELAELALRYQPGHSLWRSPIPHFSPWDCNWPEGLPPDAESPPDPDSPIDPEELEGDPNDEPATDEDDPCRQSGFSEIECENQIMAQTHPIVGSPFSLHYSSDRASGREVSDSARVRLSGPVVPPGLKRIELFVDIAGQRFFRSFAPQPHLTHVFTWDRRDGYGRLTQGRRMARISVGFVYDAVYTLPANFDSSFGVASGGTVLASVSRSSNEAVLRRVTQRMLGHWDNRALSFGGWSLGVHHSYDVNDRTLLLGTGERRSRASLTDGVIETLVDQRCRTFCGELRAARDVEVGPDGSVYFLWQSRSPFNAQVFSDVVTRLDPDGSLEDMAVVARPGLSGIGVGPDGALYYSSQCIPEFARPDLVSGYIARDEEGTAVLGGRLIVYSGVPFDACTRDVAVGSDGSLFLARRFGLERYWPDGRLTRIAGIGPIFQSGSDGPALQRGLFSIGGLSVGPEGSVYFTDSNRVRRLRPDGFIETVAGTGQSGFDGEALPATASRLRSPSDTFVRGDGSILIADDGRVRLVGSSGLLVTVAGGGAGPSSGVLARSSSFPFMTGVAARESGEIFLTDGGGFHRVRSVMPAFGELELIPDDTGRKIYEFEPTGRHLRTLDSITGTMVLTFAYDASGRLVKVEDAHGNSTLIERDENGRSVAIIAPFGQRTELEISDNGNLISITDPNKETVRFEYDDAGLLIAKRDPLDNLYTYRYSAGGRLVEVADPAGGGRILKRSLLPDGYEVTSTTAEGHMTRYRVGSQPDGTKLRSVTGPDGEVNSRATTAEGVSSLVSSNGLVTTFVEARDPRFGLQSRIAGRLSATTPSGLTRRIELDREVALTDPRDSLSLEWLRDLWSINGSIYSVFYDATTKTSTLTTPTGRSLRFTRDELGRLTNLEPPGSPAVELLYDARGRLAAVGQGTADDVRSLSYSYGPDGYLASVLDPLSRTFSFGYDAAGRLTEQTLPGNRIVGLDYDAKGNLIEVVPPGRPTHRFEYNSLNLAIRYSPPDLGPGSEDTTYQYGPDRELTLIERPDGKAIGLEYDEEGRLDAIRSPDGDIDYHYDLQTGQIGGIKGPGSVELSYDYDGHLLTDTTWSGEVAGTVNRQYDSRFQVTGRCVNDGDCVSFVRDDDGLLIRAGDLTLTRDPVTGRLLSTSLGVVTTTQTYNSFGELETYSASIAGTLVFGYTLSRDAAGRITGKNETLEGGITAWGYHYDPAGRLVRVEKDKSLFAEYSYDANGNRLSYDGAFGFALGSYDLQDRLTSYGGSTFAYTANGDLMSRSQNGHSVTYGYDVYGSLRAVELPDGLSLDYVVDGEHRRVGKKVEGTLVRAWLYKDQLNPVAELDGAGDVVARFIYATMPHVPDLIVKGEETFRVLTDHLGSVRMIVDIESGELVQRIDYDEFGRIVLNTNPGFQPFGFAGGIYDPQTELLRFGARDYSPLAGRWVQKDRARFETGALNMYEYVGGDPVNLIDVSGLAGCTVDFPGYPITIPGTSKKIPLNHAGVLAYDDEGNTRYYEYGRYPPGDHGRVRRQTVPDLEIGPDGRPTEESWEALEDALTDGPGKGHDPVLDCRDEAAYDKIIDFAEARRKNPEKYPAYTWNPLNPNTCVTFAREAVQAGLQ